MKRSSYLPWIALLLVAVTLLGVREMARPGIDASAVQARATTPPPAPEQTLSTVALALAFGFSAPGQQSSNQAGIVLKACFVSSRGDAWALVASREGEGVHRVGDRLAGGSVLRRIDVRSITLWVDGREEVVPLSGTHSTLFHPTGNTATPGRVAADSPRLLREVQ
ncbi:hypothetical protein [Pseudomonas sp. B21-031]|jgi:hypothetical protein|uniref:hypothetical protein n=1 Tax=Pseudomonas sp. B21-031 TaxID=2895482 RepID=UPI0021606F28|nr:hypothetical protein [Pseudomonas sp. B21-031]UVL66619.1 hypothetical protein LOY53_25020 [Pseudomonas sp. B21-031]